MNDSAASVQAGVVAGLAGLLVFLVLHHALIVPIWFIAPVGAPIAALGGAAVGAAYAELRPHRARPPWTAISVALTIGALLLPAVVVAELGRPILAMDAGGGGTLLVSGEEAAVRVVVGLLGVATVAGAAIGWLMARSRRAAGTLAVAAFALALGPGHNIPLLGGTPAVQKEVVILVGVVGVASRVLVACASWLARRQGSSTRLG